LLKVFQRSYVYQHRQFHINYYAAVAACATNTLFPMNNFSFIVPSSCKMTTTATMLDGKAAFKET